ncbi:hypothetical protein Prudu_016956 [Prunus dulcis]|uniref:Uncharacterized protein n=1 Tax=Prunus dulcis TaxID=3755 RepID=A0A4Y1RMD4_PRUDU|nr:hypothetical protein Prudu_016956 [Prunus dulcis]
MDPELKSIISHLAKLKKAMAESEQQLEEAYAIKLQGDVPRYVLGLLYPLQPPDEVVKIWAKQSDDPPPFTMEFDWKSTWKALRPFKGWPCKTSEVDCVAKKKSKAKKPNPMADVDPKKSWYDWYKALQLRLKTSWQKSGIYDVLALCTSGDFPCDCSLIIAGLSADLPEPLLKPDYDKPNKNFTNWIKTHFGYIESSSGAPIGSTNGVSYTKHVAFLQIQVTKEVQPLAEALADGQAVALVVLPKPMSCNPLAPIWLFQLWLQVYFPELGPANVTFRGDSLLGKSIASLPLPKHHVEDCFRFFYGCSQRSPSDLSMCLDHRYPGYLALDLASIPTLETKEEQ